MSPTRGCPTKCGAIAPDIKRSTVWRFRDRPASRQSAFQIERAAHTDLCVMGREPALSGPPPGIA
jgi:hypothetical protein